MRKIKILLQVPFNYLKIKIVTFSKSLLIYFLSMATSIPMPTTLHHHLKAEQSHTQNRKTSVLGHYSSHAYSLFYLAGKRKTNSWGRGGSASAAHSPSASQLWKKWHLPRPLSVLFGFNYSDPWNKSAIQRLANLEKIASSQLWLI